MIIINTFWVARDGDGSQFEYSEKPTWNEDLGPDGAFTGKYLRPSDIGYGLDTIDAIEHGQRCKVTISLTVDESTIEDGSHAQT